MRDWCLHRVHSAFVIYGRGIWNCNNTQTQRKTCALWSPWKYIFRMSKDDSAHHVQCADQSRRSPLNNWIWKSRKILDPSVCFTLWAPRSYKKMVYNVRQQQNSSSHHSRSLRSWQHWLVFEMSQQRYMCGACVWIERQRAKLRLHGCKLWQGPVFAKSCHIFSHFFCILTRNGESCSYKKNPKPLNEYS